jgi:low affinity sulfate transporter 2
VSKILLHFLFAGSFSRTAVNFSAGCQTAVSNIVMALTVILFLQLFARLLYYTPMAILAAIILSALPGLIDINEARYIWKVDKLDFLACIGAFVGVLFASVEIGLLVAVSHRPLSEFVHISSRMIQTFQYFFFNGCAR